MSTSNLGTWKVWWNKRPTRGWWSNHIHQNKQQKTLQTSKSSQPLANQSHAFKWESLSASSASIYKSICWPTFLSNGSNFKRFEAVTHLDNIYNVYIYIVIFVNYNRSNRWLSCPGWSKNMTNTSWYFITFKSSPNLPGDHDNMSRY